MRRLIGLHAPTLLIETNMRLQSCVDTSELTPPGSACSVQLVAADSASRVRNLYLITTDLAAERARLIVRGVAVGPLRHKDPVDTWAGGWSPGLDPQRRDYASFADFDDPDGNTWTLQERGYRAS